MIRPTDHTFESGNSPDLHVMPSSIMRDMFRFGLYDAIPVIMVILRKNCALDALSWPEAKLHGDTRAAIDKALEFDFYTTTDVVGFLMLRHSISLNFYTLPAIKKQLERRDVRRYQRIEQLFAHLPLRVWDVARRRT